MVIMPGLLQHSTTVWVEGIPESFLLLFGKFKKIRDDQSGSASEVASHDRAVAKSNTEGRVWGQG